ncbi:MAG: hypothetical protein NC923_00035 [Candidatus Omnitrophica bacterium]|nr:hypothetical protein [Candidatus Omnitrophota bacterium]
MVYLLLGQDSPSKDAQIKKLKEQFLPKAIRDFNLDILYARETNIKELQEKLLFIPVHSACRMLIVKEAHLLREEAKKFILNYVRRPKKEILLILDAESLDKKDAFLSALSRYARLINFENRQKPNVYLLNKYIELRRADYALRILAELLRNGERPEKILGGLRYLWEKDIHSAAELKRRMQLLLGCDIYIKTGKLNAVFALEKLIVRLCGLGKTAH